MATSHGLTNDLHRTPVWGGFSPAGVNPSPVLSSPVLQLVENSVCLLRNLSYHVHREIPGCERFADTTPLNQGPAPSSQKGSCFGSKKSKGEC